MTKLEHVKNIAKHFNLLVEEKEDGYTLITTTHDCPLYDFGDLPSGIRYDITNDSYTRKQCTCCNTTHTLARGNYFPLTPCVRIFHFRYKFSHIKKQLCTFC